MGPIAKIHALRAKLKAEYAGLAAELDEISATRHRSAELRERFTKLIVRRGKVLDQIERSYRAERRLALK